MVKGWSILKDIPVFLGEFGCNRLADYNSRMRHYRAYIDLSLTYGFTPCAWDDGGSFKILNRSTRTWDEVKDILIHSSPEAPSITSLHRMEDTLVFLRWNIGSGEPDSLELQRRGLTSRFSTLITLGADSTSYLDNTTLQGSYYYYRIITHFTDQPPAYSHPLRIITPSIVHMERDYFLGAPIPVPGTVQAEDFDLGGEGLSYHDLDAANITRDYRPDESVDITSVNASEYHIVNILPEEWCEYSLQVAQSGLYQVDIHYSAIAGGGKFLVDIGGSSSDTLEVTATGNWLNTGTLGFNIDLPEGEQIMRFTAISLPLFNLDKFVFSKNSASSAPPGQKDGELYWQIFQNELIIRSEGYAPLTRIDLYHISGTRILTTKGSGQTFRIKLDRIPPGIYLALARTGRGISQLKILIL